MRLYRSPREYQPQKRSVVSMGNFDGVHRGHAALIREVVNRARAGGKASVIVTFEPHTRSVLMPDVPQPVVSTLDEKAVLLEQLGVENLVAIPFDESVRRLGAEEFVQRILVGCLGASDLVVGPDHTFGSNREANRNSLRDLMRRNDISLFTTASQGSGKRPFSSTDIRSAVAKGAMAEAVRMLGHPYLISARRVEGRKIGTRLGYPTLNFEAPGQDKVLPPAGVYAAEVECAGNKSSGALYFGDCPTFGHREVHFELHLLSTPAAEPALGENTCLWVWDFVRGDVAFPTEQALTEQIRSDISRITRFFSEEHGHAHYEGTNSGTDQGVRE
jgi:riboflavin kinase / FMN adenylyltransferase